MTDLKRMLEIAKEVEKQSHDLHLDSDRIQSNYPGLSDHQAILIDSYIVQRCMGIKGLEEAVKTLKAIQ